MSARSNFLKSELNKIYDLLNVSFEYADFARLENDNRFILKYLSCLWSYLRNQIRFDKL